MLLNRMKSAFLELVKSKETYIWLVILLPVVHALLIYPGLPDQIPTHFSNSGPGRYREKSLFYFIIIPLANVGMYYLISYVSQIDKQKKVVDTLFFYYFRIVIAAALSLLALLANYQKSHPDAALNIISWMQSIGAVVFGFMTYLHTCLGPSSVNLSLTEAERHPELWKTIKSILKRWIPVATLLTLILVWVLSAQAAVIYFCTYSLVLLLMPVLLMFALSKRYEQKR